MLKTFFRKAKYDCFQLIYELFKKRPQLNYAAGHEISGVVIEVGEQVTTLSPGDRVAGMCKHKCALQIVVMWYCKTKDILTEVARYFKTTLEISCDIQI